MVELVRFIFATNRSESADFKEILVTVEGKQNIEIGAGISTAIWDLGCGST